MDVKKIQKLITSPKHWEGDIWEHPGEISDEHTKWCSDENTGPPPLKEEEIPEFKIRPIIKTEFSKGP